MRHPRTHIATLQQTTLIIMKVEGKYILVVLLLCFLAEIATSGSPGCEVECCRGCEESFTGTISKTQLNYTQLRTRSSTFYTSCGFWWLFTCARYRLQYYIHKTYKTVYFKSVGMKCDPGCQCVQRISVGPPASNATTSNVTTATSTTPGGN